MINAPQVDTTHSEINASGQLKSVVTSDYMITDRGSDK